MLESSDGPLALAVVFLRERGLEALKRRGLFSAPKACASSRPSRTTTRSQRPTLKTNASPRPRSRARYREAVIDVDPIAELVAHLDRGESPPLRVAARGAPGGDLAHARAASTESWRDALARRSRPARGHTRCAVARDRCRRARIARRPGNGGAELVHRESHDRQLQCAPGDADLRGVSRYSPALAVLLERHVRRWA